MKTYTYTYATVAYTAKAGEEYQAQVVRATENALGDGEQTVLERGRDTNAYGSARCEAIEMAEQHNIPFREYGD
jgi:23S rRNA maturation mini-RNase III